MLERDGGLDALTLTGGSSFENPMFLFRGEAPIQEMAATFPAALRPGLQAALAAGSSASTRSRRRTSSRTRASSAPRSTMPLILLGGIDRLATVEQALDEGFAFVQMARALLREPDLVHRMQADAGYESLVRPLQQVHADDLPWHAMRARRRSERTMAQQPIELILLKQVASQLALPIFLVNPDGDLLYYNEPAELILGRRYDETGELPLVGMERPLHARGRATAIRSPPERLPLVRVLAERRPVHGGFAILGLDGMRRKLSVTAVPIVGLGDRFLGAVALFWEEGTA